LQRTFGTRDVDGTSLGARRLLQEVRREVGMDVRVRYGGTAEIQRKQVCEGHFISKVICTTAGVLITFHNQILPYYSVGIIIRN
jgi:hypothetical protein